MASRHCLVALALALSFAPGVPATGYLAYEARKQCLECHLDRAGRTGLSERGQKAAAKGFRYSRNPGLVVARDRTPHTPGGVALLERRYRKMGERIFSVEQLGLAGKGCVVCHPAGKGLLGVHDRYPARDESVGAWITLEQAINRCLITQVGTRPLAPGSRSSVALQLYLHDLRPRDHLSGVFGGGGDPEESPGPTPAVAPPPPRAEPSSDRVDGLMGDLDEGPVGDLDDELLDELDADLQEDPLPDAAVDAEIDSEAELLDDLDEELGEL